MKNILYITLAIVCLTAIWWTWLAHDSQLGLTVNLPQWSNGLIEKYSRWAHDSKAKSVSYSVIIHRSQLYAFGTLWRTRNFGTSIVSEPLGGRMIFGIPDRENEPVPLTLCDWDLTAGYEDCAIRIQSGLTPNEILTLYGISNNEGRVMVVSETGEPVAMFRFPIPYGAKLIVQGRRSSEKAVTNP